MQKKNDCHFSAGGERMIKFNVKEILGTIAKQIAIAFAVQNGVDSITASIAGSAVEGVVKSVRIESLPNTVPQKLDNAIATGINSTLLALNIDLPIEFEKELAKKAFCIDMIEKYLTNDNPVQMLENEIHSAFAQSKNFNTKTLPIQNIAENLLLTINNSIVECHELTSIAALYEMKKISREVSEIAGKIDSLGEDLSAEMKNLFSSANSHTTQTATIKKQVLIPQKSEQAFVGREIELAQMDSILNQYNQVFLCGIGGIGKSELALQYITKHRSKFDSVFRVFYRGDRDSTSLQSLGEHGNLANSLMLDMPYVDYNYKMLDNTEDENFVRYYEMLQKICTFFNVLIFIDNYNTDDDPYIRMVRQLPCTLIFASRYDYGKRYAHLCVEVNTIQDEHKLKDLFYQNAQALNKVRFNEESLNNLVIDRLVEEIIETVQGHTLTIELIAKYFRQEARDGDITLLTILERLKTGGIKSADNVDIWHGRDGDEKEITAYRHICVLFKFGEMSSPRKNYLSILSYIPASGITRSEFKRRSWDVVEHIFNNMIDSGWIQEDEATGLISLHPIISEIVWYEIDPKPKLETKPGRSPLYIYILQLFSRRFRKRRAFS